LRRGTGLESADSTAAEAVATNAAVSPATEVQFLGHGNEISKGAEAPNQHSYISHPNQVERDIGNNGRKQSLNFTEKAYAYY
jgi:hypothetical protein